MLVGEAYTVPPSDTMPADPMGEPSPCMSIEAIHEMPSPANSLGAGKNVGPTVLVECGGLWSRCSGRAILLVLFCGGPIHHGLRQFFPLAAPFQLDSPEVL